MVSIGPSNKQSMLAKFAKKVLPRRPTPLAVGSSGEDDFDWGSYNEQYAKQLVGIERTQTTKLAPGDFAWTVDGTLSLGADVKPLHPNHHCLYETVGALQVTSVIEIGCGGGDHLHNLQLLFPGLDLFGYDRSEGQLSFLRQRSPHLSGLVQARDMTLPYSPDLRPADVVYTQAVIMHIHAGNGHFVALSNACRMARRAVVLMENWHRHDYVTDLKMLQQRGMIDWPEIHFSIRRWRDRPHVLLVSPSVLPFEPIDSIEPLRGIEAP